MASWHQTTIEFASVLSPEDVARLNQSLHILDYDIPELGERGITERMFRGPLLSLAELLNWCHFLTGVPCFGRQSSDTKYADEEEWAYENENSQNVCPKCSQFDLAAIAKIWGADFRGTLKTPDLERGMKRRKLFDGAVLLHPRFGEVVVRLTIRDNVVGCPELWEAWQRRGGLPDKLVCPSSFSERGLHFSLRWFASRQQPYAFKNSK